MKTLRSDVLSFWIGVVVLLIIMLLALMGCGKREITIGKSSFTVYMTDAPADYNAVNIELLNVKVHYSNVDEGDDGWVDVPTKTGIYNLLALKNNVSVIIAEDKKALIGKVDQMRLELGGNNNIETASGSVWPLKVPGGESSGLKINIDTEFKINKHIEIVLDFEADRSVVLEGNGTYKLKPVIKVKSINQS